MSPPLKEFFISPKLKGQRNYITGADIFNEVNNCISNIIKPPLRLTFKKPTQSRLKCCLYNTTDFKDEDAIGFLSFGEAKDQGNRLNLYWCRGISGSKSSAR
ncbi:hypothetical protein [Thiofilum flexile]|uniref:hypothetical protein n=1 Tax=Thiofilum flexile TaxID=125627 RepID=UPI00036DD328|nr:hypothetical protein [Thiofilum flexile]